MHIFQIISEESVYNILAHIRTCWNYTYPTGKALEEAVYRGLKPYYSKVQMEGGPLTLVDVFKDTDAFDIKGAKQLGFLQKLNGKSNKEKNNFFEEEFPNGKKIIVKVPKDVLAIIKRPNTDMEQFEGTPVDVLRRSLIEYQTFAKVTTQKSNCQNLYSIVVLYQEDQVKGFRSIFFTLEEFSVPDIDKGTRITKKNGDSAGYIGVDDTNSVCYKHVGFNPASVNSYKKYNCNRGILYTWLINEDDSLVFDKAYLEQNGSLRII